jgi:hypothetical protein
LSGFITTTVVVVEGRGDGPGFGTATRDPGEGSHAGASVVVVARTVALVVVGAAAGDVRFVVVGVGRVVLGAAPVVAVTGAGRFLVVDGLAITAVVVVVTSARA